MPEPTRNAAPFDRSNAVPLVRGVARRSTGGAASVTSSVSGGRNLSSDFCSARSSPSVTTGTESRLLPALFPRLLLGRPVLVRGGRLRGAFRLAARLRNARATGQSLGFA